MNIFNTDNDVMILPFLPSDPHNEMKQFLLVLIYFLLDIKQTAFYAVAVFTATLIEVPGRAMFQILNPMISKAINKENFDKVKDLYKKSSLNLLIISGWFFLNVNLAPGRKRSLPLITTKSPSLSPLITVNLEPFAGPN